MPRLLSENGSPRKTEAVAHAVAKRVEAVFMQIERMSL
jgi:hypothetical protein